MPAADRASFDPIGQTLIEVYFGQFTIDVLGVLVMSAEYSTGTIGATFCAAPRRTSILSAKALAFGAVALVTSEIVAFASFFVGQAFLTAPATHATIGSPGALRAVAGSGLFLCVMDCSRSGSPRSSATRPAPSARSSGSCSCCP